MTFFTPEEVTILLRLLLAHCATDFLLQPNKWVNDKQAHTWKSKYLWYHGLVTGLATAVVLWSPSLWWAILIITLSHVFIDGIKVSLEKKGSSLFMFIADQLLHVIILVLVWLAIVNGWNRIPHTWSLLSVNYRLLAYLLGYLVVIGPASIIIQFITKRWLTEINTEDSLKDAGKWIGILERILALTLVYTGQFAAIGFLMTAKSLLRLVDKPDGTSLVPVRPFSSRKHTEYVLIGTFLSFTISIGTGLLINQLANFK
ncbi:DUF3307 domain-containing protein [Chitinophaga sp. GbtcB8]|uniref:DUF3307 domain-containing protein n=1 Tax=Chitinophaga sp. GbtcB8 TaxID=2824753 RepID=UPI001C30A632|nr:DUF3307 domain-containing protein [Chitinophaga sp. GbtcB8]